jgi:hypothetical protein
LSHRKGDAQPVDRADVKKAAPFCRRSSPTLGLMNRSAIGVIALAAFASWPTVAHCDMEDIGRGVERPETYAAAVLTPQALLLKFKLGRIPGYRHPYGFVEGPGATAWAQVNLDSAVWTSIDDTKLGAFQSGRDLQTAPIRDDLEAFPSLSSTGQPLEVVHSEPIVMWVDHSKPTVAQLEASAKEVLRAAAVAHKSVVLPYNRSGCIALLVTGADGAARVTLIDPPWREYHEWWHKPVQIALYPVRLASAGLYVLACMFGGCH